MSFLKDFMRLFIAKRTGSESGVFCTSCAYRTEEYILPGDQAARYSHEPENDRLPVYVCKKGANQLLSANYVTGQNTYALVTFGAGAEIIETALKYTPCQIKNDFGRCRDFLVTRNCDECRHSRIQAFLNIWNVIYEREPKVCIKARARPCEDDCNVGLMYESGDNNRYLLVSVANPNGSCHKFKQNKRGFGGC